MKDFKFFEKNKPSTRWYDLLGFKNAKKKNQYLQVCWSTYEEASGPILTFEGNLLEFHTHLKYCYHPEMGTPVVYEIEKRETGYIRQYLSHGTRKRRDFFRRAAKLKIVYSLYETI